MAANDQREIIINLYKDGLSCRQIYEKLRDKTRKSKIGYKFIIDVVKESLGLRSSKDEFDRRIFMTRYCTFCHNPFSPKSSRSDCCYQCVPNEKASARFKRYGITQPQFDTLLESQNHQCAVCKIDLSSIPSKHVHVDHDHTTGKVRGVLCQKCNHFIGWLEKASLLESALKYLHRMPSKNVSHLVQ